MKTLIAGLFCILMAACSSTPKKPRQPDDATRVPVNRTMPLEVRNGVTK
ncbi:TrwH protein [Paraburkholderia ultramafica]|nr:TrwH protein [Paraburkholderia ultramafica]